MTIDVRSYPTWEEKNQLTFKSISFSIYCTLKNQASSLLIALTLYNEASYAL